MARFSASARVALAALVAALLSASAALEALPLQPGPTGASDFAKTSNRAEAAREAGRLDEAATLYRRALALEPAWKEGWWALGTILYEQDAHRDAARAFRRLVSLDPKNGTAHLMLALCEYQLDQDASALEHIQAAKTLGVQTDGGLPRVLTYHEGMLLLRARRFERALETLQPVASAGVEDEDLDLAIGMGVLLVRPRDVPPEGSPNRAVIMRAGRAERHHMAKDFASARRDYEALVHDAPAFPNVHYAYGRFLLATADLDSGIQELIKEIDAQPGHVRARIQVAAARYRVDSAAGLPFARQVVTLAPDYPFGHYLLGLLYFDTGDIAHAIPALETAARMRPDEAQFQFALGNAYARAGRAREAAQARAAFTRLRKNESPDAGSDALPRLDLDPAGRPPIRN